jgi:sterol desaturase/sphingolipid hydroxylase (fatty acid hydroxylase superfamily)
MMLRTNGTYALVDTWPSFWTFVFDVVCILLVEEFLFYYMHRGNSGDHFKHRLICLNINQMLVSHWGVIYRFIHKQHHEFKAPVAMAAIYCHPLEHLLVNLVPAHAGALLCGSHLSTCAIWYVFAVLNTLNSHSGYHLVCALCVWVVCVYVH